MDTEIREAFANRKSLSQLGRELRKDRHTLALRAKAMGLDFSKLRGTRMNKNLRVGKRYGRLTVLEFAGVGERCSLWRCLCDCGKESIRPSTSLCKNGVRSCGCREFRYQRGDKSKYWKGHKQLGHAKWNYVITSAAKRGMPITMSIEDAYNLFERQNGCCALTGLPLSLDPRCPKDQTASLDRIDSSKPYELENVQWVLRDVNFMKHTFSLEHFIKLAKLIAKYNT